MGKSKDIFMQMQEEFLKTCEEFENGNISALECAVNFKREMDYLNQLSEDRKNWLNENVDSITDEAEGYGKDGYKGFIFTKQPKATPSFKHIAEWVKAEKAKKEIEAKSKTAWLMVQKGGLNVDENGEEIALPKFNYTSFIKVEKAK